MKPTFKLSSPETGTEYLIYIFQKTDDGGQAADQLIPVAFMDGDDMFAAAVAAYKKIKLPRPLLLVGVGYGGSFGKPVNRRGRDYTPAAHSDEPASGGADAFLKFLTHTLWPELARRYPLNPAVRGVAGHSLGSLLVLHALFQPKPFFTHFLASAPSIWWAERAILRQAAELRARQASLPGKLYLCIGEEDSASGTGDLTLLEQQLAAQPFAQLEISSRRFPGKNHFNVLPVAFETGLAALFQ